MNDMILSLYKRGKMIIISKDSLERYRKKSEEIIKKQDKTRFFSCR
jgi:hypothetical protein